MDGLIMKSRYPTKAYQSGLQKNWETKVHFYGQCVVP